MSKKGVLVLPGDFQGVDWVAKAKEFGLNTLALHSGGGPNHDVLAALGHYGTRQFQDRVSAAGLSLEYENHVPNFLLPRDLLASKAEFFPLHHRAGERLDTGNWCIASAALRDLLRENAARLAAVLQSSTHRHYFWSGDYAGGWCHCSECEGFSYLDQHLASVNCIAEGIRRVDSRAETAYIAYLNYHEMPQKIKPGRGIFLEFAPINRCYNHAIDDPDCAINQVYWKSLQRHLEIFPARDAHVLEYWLDVSYFSQWKRPAKKINFNHEVMKRDLEAYMKLEIRNFTTFAVWMDGEYFDRYGEKDLQSYAEILTSFLT
jgi:hypothetical protein